MVFAGIQAVQAQGINGPTGPGSVGGVNGNGARNQPEAPSAPVEVKLTRRRPRRAAGTKTMNKVHELGRGCKATNPTRKADAQYKLDEDYARALINSPKFCATRMTCTSLSQVGYVHYRLGPTAKRSMTYNHALALNPICSMPLEYRGEAIWASIVSMTRRLRTWIFSFMHARAPIR